MSKKDDDSEIEERRREVKHAREMAYKNGKVLCKHCDFTGFVTAHEKETELRFAFRCIACAAAERIGLSQKIKAWGYHLLEKFELKTI